LKNVFLILALFLTFSFAVEGPVSHYGKLQVRAGTPFIDGIKAGGETIKLVQIRGVSFGWSNTGWESSRFFNAEAVERMVKDWKAEVIRAPYGSTSLAFSSDDAAANRSRVETVVDAAIQNGVYVIIDWHSHSAQNEVEKSKDFFEHMANKYGSYDNVIFELYNEPTGADWPTIKTYAEAIIPVIRNHSSNLILVGTPNYSQKIEDVVAIKDPNLGYVVHFYAASHPVSAWRDNISKALTNKLPIFVTEYGTTHADGGDPNSQSGNHYNSHNATRTDEWHSFMDSKKISSVAWNINDKYEGSAFFGIAPSSQFDQSIVANWSDESKMTASGQYIFKKLNYYHDNPTPIIKTANLPKSEPEDAQIYTLSGKKAEGNLKSGVYVVIFKQNGLVQRKILKIVK